MPQAKASNCIAVLFAVAFVVRFVVGFALVAVFVVHVAMFVAVSVFALVFLLHLANSSPSTCFKATQTLPTGLSARRLSLFPYLLHDFDVDASLSSWPTYEGRTKRVFSCILTPLWASAPSYLTADLRRFWLLPVLHRKIRPGPN